MEKNFVLTREELQRTFPAGARIQQELMEVARLKHAGTITAEEARKRERKLERALDAELQKQRQKHLDARIQRDLDQLRRERATGRKEWPPVNRVYLKRLIAKRDRERQ